MNKSVLETNFARYEIKDGILFFEYKTGMKISLNSAREIVKTRLEYTEGKNLPNLINSQGVVSLEKEARDFFSSSDGVAGVKAGALLVNSVFNTLLGNFFLKVSRPKIPARIFTEKEKALEWLQQYK